MKLVIPMAGRGTRLRPHTHVTPKPLLPVVGIPMVERIVNTFIEVLPRPLTEAVFVLGDFPAEVNEALTAICERHGMRASFVYQDKALGTGHAIHAARDYLDGEVITVFADTLFGMDRAASLDGADVLAWVKHVEDPSRFGVAVRDGDRITELVEKPAELISNEALIGIYYVRNGSELKAAIQKLIDDDITGHGNEYQLTDAFDILLKKGLIFQTEDVSEWLDCGTIEAFVETSFHLLEREHSVLGTVDDSELIPPVFIGEGATICNSTIGPNVVVEAGARISGSTISSSIIFGGASVNDSRLSDSIVGHHADVSGMTGKLDIGDHSSVG
jgi:glucose-1-phosphate thymidylyltransferase